MGTHDGSACTKPEENRAKKKQQNKLRIITEEIKHAWHKYQVRYTENNIFVCHCNRPERILHIRTLSDISNVKEQVL
jgi:hypothetical protein